MNQNAAKAFQAYLSTRKILIADPSAGSRAGLAKTMCDLGAKVSNITMVTTYEQAEQNIQASKPHVIICDYDLGKRCGLDLLQSQRKQNPGSKDSLFILVTGNTSQSAVAQAAEEDVDTFILKPYTLDVLKRSILKAAVAKINPSLYMKKIDDGKALLEQGKLDEAIAAFEAAKPHNPKPSLAMGYLGQVKFIKKVMAQAQADYDTGLQFNKIHYKCLIGMFELMQAQNKNVEAYDVVKRVTRYFPANPQRLTQVLRLAIVTKSYEDIERYYQNFTAIDIRNEELIKYVCAALVVTGKFYLQNKLMTRALELFTKAATTAAGRVKILREIIESLIQNDLVTEAAEFLKRFPASTHTAADYLSMEYLIADKQLAATFLVERGRQLLAKDIHDPVVYRILIRRSVEAGLRDAAETLVQTAAQKWAPQAKDFQALLTPATAQTAKKK
jgi:CheY-like chemotaxis protein